MYKNPSFIVTIPIHNAYESYVIYHHALLILKFLFIIKIGGIVFIKIMELFNNKIY